jgi:ribonuclease P protein component
MIETDALGPSGERRETTARPPGRLKQHADFQRTGRGRRTQAQSFTLQSQRRPDASPETVARFGLTVTRKVGNAVVRNRIRRRLKEVLRLNSALETLQDHDYVLVVRIEALSRPFDLLKKDLERALGAAHSKGTKPGSRHKPHDRDERR